MTQPTEEERLARALYDAGWAITDAISDTERWLAAARWLLSTYTLTRKHEHDIKWEPEFAHVTADRPQWCVPRCTAPDCPGLS